MKFIEQIKLCFETIHDIVKKYTDIEYLEALQMTSNYY
jgi:hypothetical protein